jgi:hypothetical protein
MESKEEIDDDCAWWEPPILWRGLGEYGAWYLLDISSGETMPLAFGEWELERGPEGLEDPEEIV